MIFRQDMSVTFVRVAVFLLQKIENLFDFRVTQSLSLHFLHTGHDDCRFWLFVAHTFEPITLARRTLLKDANVRGPADSSHIASHRTFIVGIRVIWYRSARARFTDVTLGAIEICPTRTRCQCQREENENYPSHACYSHAKTIIICNQSRKKMSKQR